MRPTDRARMCAQMAQALAESVEAYEEAVEGRPGSSIIAGYETPKNGQANKTAIRRQVTALRQSLLALGEDIRCN